MTDPLRQDGVVPDDDIVSRHRINEHIEAVMDGNGTIHLADPGDDPPRDRIVALSPTEASDLGDWLDGNTPG